MTSFIICSIDQQKFRDVFANIRQLMGSSPHEIIGVHDAKSMCEGYNRAIKVAKGERLVFCHDDIEILSSDFAAKLDSHLSRFDLVGVAGTDRVIHGVWSFAGPPHNFGQVAQPGPQPGTYDVSIFNVPRRIIGQMHALDGLFIACRRSVVEKVRFDEQTFDGWHGYDVDFTFAAHLAGFKLAVACDIAIIHASRGPFDRLTHYVQLFNRKYLQQLYPMAHRGFCVQQVRATSKAEVLEIMTPRFWDEPAVS